MKMLHFLPWCPINDTVEIDQVVVLPYRRGKLHDAITGDDQETIEKVLSIYRDVKGEPINRAAVLHCKDKPVIAEVTAQEREKVREAVDLLCFAALCNRDLCSQLRYCNATNFTLYIQEVGESMEHIRLITRRRGARTEDGRKLDDLQISAPAHASVRQTISVDQRLLEALLAKRGSMQGSAWVRWADAIACYNQANTDSTAFSRGMEWTLCCGAFERVLESNSNARDFSEAFSNALNFTETLVSESTLQLEEEDWCRDHMSEWPLNRSWAYRFYQIRGDYAHGRQETHKPSTWSEDEHVMIAVFSFPLIIRCLLSDSGFYELRNEDKAERDVMERLMQEPFEQWEEILREQRLQYHDEDIRAGLEARS